MDRSILNEVIEAEKEIQRDIEQEQKRIQLRLEQLKEEAEATVAREEQRGTFSGNRSGDAVRAKTAEAVRKVIEESEALAVRLERIDGRTLAAIVMKHLPRLLLG